MERAQSNLGASSGLPALRPQSPWFGYSLGDWLPQWDEAAKRAAAGRYLENGRISEKQRAKGLKPETKFRPDRRIENLIRGSATYAGRAKVEGGRRSTIRIGNGVVVAVLVGRRMGAGVPGPRGARDRSVCASTNADLISRVVAQRVAVIWGQQVILDNRPGGATNDRWRRSRPPTAIPCCSQDPRTRSISR